MAGRQLSAADSFARHTEQVAATLEFGDLLLDEFGLSLDPQADGYFQVLYDTTEPASAEYRADMGYAVFVSYDGVRLLLDAVSSFGAESVALLHLIAMVDRNTPVLFIDTRLLVPETLAYQAEVSERLGLKDVRIIRTSEQELAELALSLRERVELPASTRYRLVGVGLSNFVDEDGIPQPLPFE